VRLGVTDEEKAANPLVVVGAIHRAHLRPSCSLVRRWYGWVAERVTNLRILDGSLDTRGRSLELSTEDENFRFPLNDFMTQWTEKLASLLQDLHADWSEERAQLQARQVISSIQGSIVILKVSQDIQVLENNMTDLKKNYC